MTTRLAHAWQHERVAPSSHPTRRGHRFPPTGYAIATLSDGRFLPLAMIPLAWLEVTAQAECEGSYIGPGMLAEDTDDACAHLPRQRKRACPLSNLHVEAANLDELWSRLYDAVRTVLAWQRKETDDEAFPITKAAS